MTSNLGSDLITRSSDAGFGFGRRENTGPGPSAQDRALSDQLMRRTIQREVDNRLSRLLLDGQLRPGQHITVGVADGRLAFEAGAGQPASGDPPLATR